MKNKINNKNLSIAKITYIKIKNINVVKFFIYLFKIKSSINLILKFILLFMVLLRNTNDLTSMWDLGDLALKMVEQESTDIKVEKVEDTNDNILQTDELTKDIKKEEEEIDFDAMELGEWLEYLRVHQPQAYWFWVFAFVSTSVFCVWLMHYLIGPGFPPRES